jgi:glycosyltransferase involved in cell wall biosynthesis
VPISGAHLDTLLQATTRASTIETSGPDSDNRPGLAIVANVITPYRANLHRLIAAGIPEFKLHTLITHGIGDFDWRVDAPVEIHATSFSVPGEHPLDNPLRRPLAEWRKAGRLIRYFKAHNVRAAIFCFYRYLSYLRVMDYCSRARLPFWVNLDSNIRSEPQLSGIQKFVKRNTYAWWLKRASGVLSMGKLGDQFFLKYGADPNRLYRVPYWPEFDDFARCDPVALQRFQQKFGLDGGRRYLLFSGRLVREKRVDLLIDAFAAVAAQRPEWDLLITGDGPLASELRRRVPEALRPRVTWTGFLDGAENVLAFHAADVLVLPSDREPWALVVQEAMAAGMPVVASDVVGAAHELVTDGVSGRIFARSDCGSLRQALEDITNPDRIADYKQQARGALKRYRELVDPVAEFRRALGDAGVLNQFN